MPPTCCHTQHKGMTERFRKMSVKEEPCQPFRGSERVPRPANFGLVPLVPPFQRREEGVTLSSTGERSQGQSE